MKTINSRGFTLTEIMTTTAVLGLLTAGVFSFVFSTMRVLFTSEQKLLINSDIRDLTNELVENARESNFFVLYQSFNPQTINGSAVRRDLNNNGTVNMNDRLQAGQEGNFLVFVYYEDPFFDSRLLDNDPTNDPPIMNVRVERIVGYWTAPHRNLSGENAIYKFDSDDARAPSDTTWTTDWGVALPINLDSGVSLESLLPPDTTAWASDVDFPIVVNDTVGLSDNQFNFVNFQNRSVLVRTKILHGNQAKQVTNTYNFTVTPRG